MIPHTIYTCIYKHAKTHKHNTMNNMPYIYMCININIYIYIRIKMHKEPCSFVTFFLLCNLTKHWNIDTYEYIYNFVHGFLLCFDHQPLSGTNIRIPSDFYPEKASCEVRTMAIARVVKRNCKRVRELLPRRIDYHSEFGFTNSGFCHNCSIVLQHKLNKWLNER